MSEKTDPVRLVFDVFRMPAAQAPMAPMMMLPMARQVFEAQDRMLDEAETFSRHWFERRHEAARTAAETTAQLTSNGGTDYAAASRALTDWCAHSMERINRDAQEGMDVMLRCTTHAARAVPVNGGETAAKGGKSTG